MNKRDRYDLELLANRLQITHDFLQKNLASVLVDQNVSNKTKINLELSRRLLQFDIEGLRLLAPSRPTRFSWFKRTKK